MPTAREISTVIKLFCEVPFQLTHQISVIRHQYLSDPVITQSSHTAMSFEPEEGSRKDFTEVDESQLFSDLVTFEALQGASEGLSPANSASETPADHPSNAFRTITPTLGSDEHKPEPATNTHTLATVKTASPPVPEGINGDSGGQPPRGKKRRRSRNSPEPDYSQIIVELNKKRKRTGQACDRCRVCSGFHSHCPSRHTCYTTSNRYANTFSCRSADTNVIQAVQAASTAAQQEWCAK